MAISKRKNKAGKITGYQVLIDRRDPVTGIRNRMVVGTYATKKAATKAEANALTERERGTLLTPDTTTVGDLLDEYLRVEVPRTVRPENRQTYESVIRNHLKPVLGHVQARKLSPEHVEKLLGDMQASGYSSSLISKARMRLSSALRMGVRWGIVGTNVAEIARSPKIIYKRATIWTPEAVTRFLDVARDETHWPFWLLLVETGARQSELLGLSWQDVDLDRATLRIGRRTVRLLNGTPILKDGGKSAASSRMIGLTKGTVGELRSWRTRFLEQKLAAGPEWNPDGLLFTTASGKPLSSNNIRRIFDRIVTAAGVPKITPHAVRKTAITLALANGASPKAVAARAGHADARVTLDVYSQVTSEMDTHLLDIVSAIMPDRSARETS